MNERLDSAMQMVNEVRINFATAQDIAGIARHAIGMIIAHPLQVMRVVPASFKLSGFPRPKAFALRAEHLIAAFGFVNKNFAIGARFSIAFQKSERRHGVRIANVVGVIAKCLRFPALRASEFVTGSAFPSGRNESVAVVMSAAVNELVGCVGISVSGGAVALQLSFCLQQIKFESGELFDLLRDILNLCINVRDEQVMRDGGLRGRKQSLFLSEENGLLVVSEIALKECLSESEMHNLRMSESGITEHALGNSDIIATKKGLIASSAS